MKERFRALLASQTVLSIAYIGFGLVLVSRPGLSGTLICTILGAGALVYGLVKLFSYWRLKSVGDLFQGDLALGVIFAAVGIFTLVRPDVILSILPIVLGIALVLASLSKFQRAFQLKGFGSSRWPSVLTAGILTCLLGAVLLVNPFRAAAAMIQCIGIGLIVDGASELWAVYCMARV